MKKLKFYLLGLVPGLLIVFFILNKKNAGCAYLPNARVTAETLTKTFSYSPGFKKTMDSLHITEKFLRDSLIAHGRIDFAKSKAQQQPCPEYLIEYPVQHPAYKVTYQKCKETAEFLTIQRLAK